MKSKNRKNSEEYKVIPVGMFSGILSEQLPGLKFLDKKKRKKIRRRNS